MERMAESIMNVATTLPEGGALGSEGPAAPRLARGGRSNAVASGRARRIDPRWPRHLHAPRPDTLWSAQSVR